MNLSITKISLVSGKDVIEKYPHYGITTEDHFVATCVVSNEKKEVQLHSAGHKDKRNSVTELMDIVKE